MSAQDIINILIAIAVLGWILYRQLQPRPIKERQPYRLMFILVVLGRVQILQLAGRDEISAAGYLALVLGLSNRCWIRLAARAVSSPLASRGRVADAARQLDHDRLVDRGHRGALRP